MSDIAAKRTYELRFPIPGSRDEKTREWTPDPPELVGQHFTIMLMGPAILTDGLAGFPQLLQNGSWMLDGSNDYWLRIEPGSNGRPEGRLTWRYHGQQEICEHMVGLFKTRFTPGA